MSEEVVEKTVTKKAPTEYTAVTMTDGRVVQFPGARNVDKTVTISEDGDVEVRFDFRNGETKTLRASELDEKTQLTVMGHGMAQKVGDEYAGVKNVDDMVIACEEMMDRLRKGEFTVARAAGDSFSGASIVIRAIAEITGKTIADVKAFLNKKLETAKEKGEKLSRADLYSSFRNPDSKTGVVIERLEREARSKNAKMDADELLSEM